jgi:hypothetical protein
MKLSDIFPGGALGERQASAIRTQRDGLSNRARRRKIERGRNVAWGRAADVDHRTGVGGVAEMMRRAPTGRRAAVEPKHIRVTPPSEHCHRNVGKLLRWIATGPTLRR